ncbi:MAG: YxeA family protein [Streptococcaceae bacterium]|nr:YxeA family protein [Streptococcaceae bacterium]
MKKVLLVLVTVLVVLGGAFYAWKTITYGGETYYVKIVADGKKVQTHSDSGEVFDRYDYEMKAFNKNGDEKTLIFTADHNLRHNAYLSLTVNDKKGVTNWNEVQEKDIPQKALDKLK